jgi:hypothetical protein
MTDWDGRAVIRGFAEELFERLPADAIAGPVPEQWGSRDAAAAAYWGQRTAAFHGIVTWSPTIDPERLKVLSQEMLLEAGVRLVFHGWAALPIVEQGRVRGLLFESKAGRQALLAQVVVDASGDGDVFARAGAQFDTDSRSPTSTTAPIPPSCWAASTWPAGSPSAAASRSALPTACAADASSPVSSRRPTFPGATTWRCSSGRGSRGCRRWTSTT